MKDNKQFVLMNLISYASQRENLNDAQKSALLIMSTFLEFNKKGVMFDTKGGNMTVNTLQKLMGYSNRKQAVRIVSHCEDLGLVLTEKKGQDIEVTLTEAIFRCGYSNGEDYASYIKVYKKSLRELLIKMKPKDIGFLFDLLPHFHKDSHILCENPTWEGIDGMQAWSCKTIADKINIPERQVKTKMKALRSIGFLFTLLGKGEAHWISPEYASRKEEFLSVAEIEKVATLYSSNLKLDNYMF